MSNAEWMPVHLVVRGSSWWAHAEFSRVTNRDYRRPRFSFVSLSLRFMRRIP